MCESTTRQSRSIDAVLGGRYAWHFYNRILYLTVPLPLCQPAPPHRPAPSQPLPLLLSLPTHLHHDAKELDLSLDGLLFLAFRVMNRDHQEKLARVNAWLRSTFDGDRVPAFQATEANVERLYALCSACEQVFVASICVSAQFFCNQCRFPVIVAHRPMQRDAELGIVTESALQMQQEYSAKASAITSELGFAGIDIESLPANVADNVNCLVSFAASLGCEDCNEATLCCALEELEQRRVNVEDSLAAERNRQQAIRDCTNDVSIRLQAFGACAVPLTGLTRSWLVVRGREAAATGAAGTAADCSCGGTEADVATPSEPAARTCAG